MGKYISLFEDGFIFMPRDASLEDDHRAVEYTDGIPMVPKLERKDLKDADLVRHGDGAIAGALMNFAALNPVGVWQADYIEVPLGGYSTGQAAPSNFMRPSTSLDLPQIERRGDW